MKRTPFTKTQSYIKTVSEGSLTLSKQDGKYRLWRHEGRSVAALKTLQSVHDFVNSSPEYWDYCDRLDAMCKGEFTPVDRPEIGIVAAHKHADHLTFRFVYKDTVWGSQEVEVVADKDTLDIGYRDWNPQTYEDLRFCKPFTWVKPDEEGEEAIKKALRVLIVECQAFTLKQVTATRLWKFV